MLCMLNALLSAWIYHGCPDERHPGVCRDPDPWDRLDSRVHENGHCPVSTVFQHSRVYNTL
jgi:hypothetical protein